MKKQFYQDVVVGQTTTFNRCYHVSEEEIIEMASRFDPQPFHIDKEAAKSSIFGGLTASSTHLFSMMDSIGTKDTSVAQIAAVSALGFDNMRTRHPVRPGDELRVRSTVTEKRSSASRPELGIVSAYNEMFNQDDIVVMSFDHAFLVAKKTTED